MPSRPVTAPRGRLRTFLLAALLPWVAACGTEVPTSAEPAPREPPVAKVSPELLGEALPPIEGKAPDFPPPAVPLAAPSNPQWASDPMPGALSVNDSGQASYTLPLRVPIGINELAPGISLAYQGHRGNGLVGAGWGVTGFSSIYRCPRNTGTDESAMPISDSSSDVFCLDGQRLVVTLGVYGADGAEYRTEQESFVRVFSRGNPVGSGGYTGPVSFEAWMPDGRVLTYGGSEGTVEKALGITRTWGLASARDRYNNTLSFTYIQQYCDYDLPVVLCFNAGLIPSEIRYGSHQGQGGGDPVLASDRKVRFVYGTDRGDRGGGYSRGLSRLTYHRLEAVEMVVGTAVTSSYQLSYTETNGMSRLTSVTECSSGTPPLCRLPTTFQYGSAAQSTTRTVMSTPIDWQFGNGPQSRSFGRTLVLDVNGDGRDDLVVPRPQPRQPNGGVDFTYRILLAKSDGSAGFEPEIDTGIWSGDEAYNGGNLVPCFSQGSVMDFNHDGKDDLVDQCQNRYNGWRVFLSTGTGFTTQPLSFMSAQYFGARDYVEAADLDGDGWTDILACESTGGTATRLGFYKNRGAALGFEPVRALPSLGRGCHIRYQLLDVDGDGVVNVLRPERDPYEETLRYYQPWEQSPPWKALVMTAGYASWVDAGFAPPWVHPSFMPDPNDTFSYNWEFPNGGLDNGVITPFVSYWQLKPIDYNGDGLVDLLHYRADTTQTDARVALYVNTGRGFNRVGVPLGSGVVMDNYAFYRATVVDWDHDGRQDLLIPIGAPTQSPTLTLFRSSGNNGPFRQALTLSGSVYEYSVPVTADLDGDGDAELLLPTDYSTLSIIQGTKQTGHLLTEAADGLGRTERVLYAPDSGTPSVYTKTTTCLSNVALCVRRVAPLVSTLHELASMSEWGWPTLKSVRQTRFEYQDARVGLHGRGWLGFSRITRRNYDGAAVQKSTQSTAFDNSTFYASLPQSSATRWYPFAGHARNQLTTWPTYTNLANQLVERRQDVLQENPEVRLSADGRPFVVTPVTQTKTSDVFLLDPTFAMTVQDVTTQLQVDAYGNTTREEVTWRNSAGAVLETQVTVGDYTLYGWARDQWLIRLPWRQTTTSTTPEGTKTRTVGFLDYSAPGRPGVIIREPDSSAPQLHLRTEIAYDVFGNVRSITRNDLPGTFRSETFTHDARGLTLTGYVNPEGLPRTYTFDPVHGGVLSGTDENGITRTLDYDGLGRAVSATTPEGTTSVTYSMHTPDPAVLDMGRQRVRKATQGQGWVEQVHDAFGRVVQTRSSGYFGKVVTQELEYDWANRVTYESAPHLVNNTTQGHTTYEYDGLGRLRRERRLDEDAPNGVAVTEFGYATPDWISTTGWEPYTLQHALEVRQSTDPKNATTLQVLGHQGQVLLSRDAQGAFVQHRHGAFGVPTRTRGASGHITTYEHDILGRRTRLTDPDQGDEWTSYSAFDDVASVTDGLGQVQFLHDRLGRLKTRTEPDGSRSVFTYDGAGPGEMGRLIQARTETALGAPLTQQTFTYVGSGNGRGQLSGVTRSMAGRTFQTNMTYDAFGRLDVLTYPATDDGVRLAVRHLYEESGRLGEVVDATTTGTIRLGDDFRWKVIGDHQGYRINGELLGDYYMTSWGIQNHSARVSDIYSGNFIYGFDLQNITYKYDAGGELVQQNDHLDSHRSRSYQYDTLGRLTHVSRQHGTGPATLLEQFQYDTVGNITSRSSVGTYQYTSTRPHAVTAAGGSTYQYDARGNQTLRQGPQVARGRQEITYTSFGLPSRIRTGTGSEELLTDFLYDAFQTRAHTSTSTGKQTWHVGEQYELEVTASGAQRHRFRFAADGRAFAEVVREQSAAGQPLTAPRTWYLHPDRLGTPETVTDALCQEDETCAVVTRPEYDAFGRMTSTPADIVQGFTGHRNDADLGLIDMRGRFYDPTLGRFVSPDPLVTQPYATQGLNRYSYVRNNPLRAVDPSGFEEILIGISRKIDYGNKEANKVQAPARPSAPAYPADAPTLASARAAEAAAAAETAKASTAKAAPQAATTGQAVAYGAAGLATGFGMGVGTAYTLGAISAVCPVCAVGIGVGLVGYGIYQLANGGASALWESGKRIYNGQGTTDDYFAAGSMVGGALSGRVAGAAHRTGVAHGTKVAGALRSRMNAAPGGVGLMDDGDIFGINAAKADPIPGYTDVVIHGHKHGFSRSPNGANIDAYELAQMIHMSGEYTGGSIRLISCNTGACGATAAQNLANAMGVRVLAPNNIIWATEQGLLTIGSKPALTPRLMTGRWKLFLPRGNE